MSMLTGNGVQDLIRSLQNCMKEVVQKSELKQRLLAVCEAALGLKISAAPFNAHKDLMRKLIDETFKGEELRNESNQKIIEFSTTLKVVVEKATNLPAMDADGSCDPYVRIFLEKSRAAPLRSKYIENSRNPEWNQSFIVYITKNDLAVNRKLIFEMWDKDPTSIYAILRDFRGIRNIHNLWSGLRDIMELIFSFVFRTESDDIIGATTISLNEIPSTGSQEVRFIQDVYGRVYGSITISFDWGTKHEDNNTRVSHHVRVYKHFITWHLQQAPGGKTDKVGNLSLPDVELLNYKTFLFIPTLSLINQHRIRCNMSHYEDSVIRRVVMCELILSDALDENQKLMLVGILSNEDLSAPSSLKWHLRSYRNTLFKFEEFIINKLLKSYISELKFLVTLSKDVGIKRHKVLLVLRVFSHYDTKFPSTKIRQKINSELSTIISQFIDENLKKLSNWALINERLTFIEDILQKYWSQSLSAVLGVSGKQNVKNSFEKIAKPSIEIDLNTWKIDRDQQFTEKLLKEYEFAKRLDFLISGCLVKEQILPLKMKDAGPIIKAIEVPLLDKPRTSEGTGFFGAIGGMLSSILPKFDEETVEDKALQQTLEAAETLLNVSELEFGEISRSKYRVYDMEFYKIFSPSFFESLVNEKRKKFNDIIEKTISEEIKIIKEKANKNTQLDKKSMVGTKVDDFFYNVVGETIFFYVRIQKWDERLLRALLCCCLQLIKSFCEKYSRKLSNGAMEANKSKDETLSKWLIYTGVNDIFRLTQIHLRRDLIEMLTDRKASEIWKCIYSYIEENETFSQLKRENKVEEMNELLEKTSLPTKSKEVIAAAILIDRYVSETFPFENELIFYLGNVFMRKTLESMSNEIAKPQKREKKTLVFLDNFGKNLKKDLELQIDFIQSPQSKMNFIIYCDHNFDSYLQTQFRHFYLFWTKENHLQKIAIQMQICLLGGLIREAKKIIIELHELIRNSRIEMRESNYLPKESFIESDEFKKGYIEMIKKSSQKEISFLRNRNSSLN
ncbi:protein unc-13 D-like protein [Dinothrombium tinctorium]|uniref:Protein unc-13 D-like protein n=1 Tax=Dinothrombium tinctorium TaxID=1965070 RepID=A0A443QLA8_9ACAR|nr:protein unc-13 D-like protein [Dinothrombium tinctorium]